MDRTAAVTPQNTVVGHCFSYLAEYGEACVFVADVCIGALEECGEPQAKALLNPL